jgi:hypothetical protein
VISDKDYASIVYIVWKLLRRDPIMFLATDDAQPVTYFRNLPAMTGHAFTGTDANTSVNDSTRLGAGDTVAGKLGIYRYKPDNTGISHIVPG